jgi:hypothetical protein
MERFARRAFCGLSFRERWLGLSFAARYEGA